MKKAKPPMAHRFEPEHFYDGLAEKVAAAPKSVYQKFGSLFAKKDRQRS